MKPAEIEFALEQFRQEVESLKGNDLLDKWIAFENSPDSREPDLGLLKSNCLEVALIQEFGLGEWQDAVNARKKAQES